MRRWVWLQLVLGWLPVWVLYSLLIASAHGVAFWGAALAGLHAVAVAALLGIGVQRLTARLAWPHPMRPGFLAVHVVAAALYAGLWLFLVTALEILISGHGVGRGSLVRVPWAGFFVTGVWLYVMVAGVSYAARATERAARAEALAARSQLAALRAQLHPHFLFNALHTVVQLIPRRPAEAAQAAEQLAGLLRIAIEEDRDLVTVADEQTFVQRYLDLERVRFGERLQARIALGVETAQATLPAFALQALVENAVRHGAAPRVEPTEIAVEGRVANGTLTLTVRDTGAGARPEQLAGGTGLRRLRERLAALYGDAARLELAPGATDGFAATLVIPQRPDDAA
jgi:anti-sigma regulatory factor (Ser/Thr protein kinase)